jgi:uncharacterized protein (TIGR02646 family)
MIGIDRPRAVPPILVRRGAARAAQIRADYLADRDAYRTDRKSFEFEKHAYYAHRSVKDALRNAQHDKCAFCESKISHIAYGDIDHVRPKAGYQQRRGGPLKRPGYYWLAYTWENLLLVCEICNRREKKSLFPLEKGSKRARSPQHRIENEQVLFVDPSREDPGQHLTFREHVMIAANGSKRGRITRRGLDLNRPELKARREALLSQVRMLHELFVELPGSSFREKATTVLRQMASPAAEYSAMVRAYLLSKGFEIDPASPGG